MTTVEVLRKAKAEVIAKGWVQGGKGGLGGHNDLGEGPCCIAVAVQRAGYGGRFYVKGLETDVQAAMDVLSKVATGLSCWNDTQGRTLEEVLDAFDRAIALATPGGVTPGGGEG